MHIQGANKVKVRRRRAEEDEATRVSVNWRERCASQVLAGRPLLS